MSYIELGSTVFRGALVAANGTAEFTLTADAINAVDTINIRGSEVTYTTYVASGTLSAVRDTVMFTTQINVPEAAVVELTADSTRLKRVLVDGVALSSVPRFMIGRWWYDPNGATTGGYYPYSVPAAFHSAHYKQSKLIPFVVVRQMSAGLHTIAFEAQSTGNTNVKMLARYIRSTGA